MGHPYTYGALGIYLFFGTYPRTDVGKIMPLGLGFLFPLTPNNLRVLADQKWLPGHTRLTEVTKVSY